MDLSPSRTTAIEFDNPTPTRRRLSSRKPTSFDPVSVSVKRQRESIMILDEVRTGRVEEITGHWKMEGWGRLLCIVGAGEGWG